MKLFCGIQAKFVISDIRMLPCLRNWEPPLKQSNSQSHSQGNSPHHLPAQTVLLQPITHLIVACDFVWTTSCKLHMNDSNGLHLLFVNLGSRIVSVTCIRTAELIDCLTRAHFCGTHSVKSPPRRYTGQLTPTESHHWVYCSQFLNAPN